MLIILEMQIYSHMKEILQVQWLSETGEVLLTKLNNTISRLFPVGWAHQNGWN